jgi:hypothetical protein
MFFNVFKPGLALTSGNIMALLLGLDRSPISQVIDQGTNTAPRPKQAVSSQAAKRNQFVVGTNKRVLSETLFLAYFLVLLESNGVVSVTL